MSKNKIKIDGMHVDLQISRQSKTIEAKDKIEKANLLLKSNTAVSISSQIITLKIP